MMVTVNRKSVVVFQVDLNEKHKISKKDALSVIKFIHDHLSDGAIVEDINNHVLTHAHDVELEELEI